MNYADISLDSLLKIEHLEGYTNTELKFTYIISLIHYTNISLHSLLEVKHLERYILVDSFIILVFKKQVYVGFPSLFSGLFGQYVNELHSSFALQKASHACHGSPGNSSCSK